MKAALASACANIALAKYWGKLDVEANTPAVPSLSLTLDHLQTRTLVRFDPELAEDRVELDGEPASGRARSRIVSLLDQMRELGRETDRAWVKSANAFPTAAGLASSASGFAALVAACDAALKLELSPTEQSRWSRRASASAARSHFAGYVELPAGDHGASQVAPGEHFPLSLLVAVTKRGPKAIGSTEAMERTRKTSPYYASWLEHAPLLFQRCRAAVLDRDFVRLGEAMEQSTLLMHGSMLGAAPAIVYLEAPSVAVIHQVQALRAQGIGAYFTMDAGPHVKVLCHSEQAKVVRQALRDVPGVQEVLVGGSGPGPRILACGEEAWILAASNGQ